MADLAATRHNTLVRQIERERERERETSAYSFCNDCQLHMVIAAEVDSHLCSSWQIRGRMKTFSFLNKPGTAKRSLESKSDMHAIIARMPFSTRRVDLDQ